MNLDGSSLISFIIHGGFLTACPNTALEPAAVKHSDTPFPPRGGGGEGGKRAQQRRTGRCHTLKQIIQSILSGKFFKKIK